MSRRPLVREFQRGPQTHVNTGITLRAARFRFVAVTACCGPSGDEAVGGLFVDLWPVRAASSRCGVSESAVAAMASSRRRPP